MRLREDLKIMSEKMGKAAEERRRVDERLGVCCRSMNRCERKVARVVKMAGEVIKMVKVNMLAAVNGQDDENKMESEMDCWIKEGFEDGSEWEEERRIN